MTNQIFHTGCVENRNDPLKLGRCQVRIVGLHTEDKTILPTDELPWAYPLIPITSATISGIGRSPTGVVQGSWVLCIFLDDDKQQPVMIGTIGGIPHTRTASFVNEATNSIVTTDETGDLVNANGDSVSAIISELLTPPKQSNHQESGKKYDISAVSSNGTTTYYMNSNKTSEQIATAYYDEGLNKFLCTLINPDNYTEKQYLPFTGVAPKQFDTLKEMLAYFEQNF